MKVQLDLSNMGQKEILKMQQVLIHQNLPPKNDLANLIPDGDKLDIDK